MKEDINAKLNLANLAAEILSDLISEGDAERLLLERADAMLATAQRRLPALAEGITHSRTEVEGHTLCIVTVKGHDLPLITDVEGYSSFVIGLLAASELLAGLNQEGN